MIFEFREQDSTILACIKNLFWLDVNQTISQFPDYDSIERFKAVSDNHICFCKTHQSQWNVLANICSILISLDIKDTNHPYLRWFKAITLDITH